MDHPCASNHRFDGSLCGCRHNHAQTNYVLAVRKENADAAERRQSRAVELRTAARLIGNDFLIGQEAAGMLVDKKRWAPQDVELSLRAWEKDRGILARELALNDWNAVVTAAIALSDFRTFHTAPRSNDNASDAMAENGKPVFKDIKAGLDALQPYMLDKRGEPELLGEFRPSNSKVDNSSACARSP